MTRRPPNFPDDGPTRPEARGVPAAPLDLDPSAEKRPTMSDARAKTLEAEGVASVATKPAPAGRPGQARRVSAVELDALLTIYESALRAWGQMTVLGAPRNLEADVTSGATEIGGYLRELGRERTEAGEQRIAQLAVRVKLAVAKYETWRATRK